MWLGERGGSRSAMQLWKPGPGTMLASDTSAKHTLLLRPACGFQVKRSGEGFRDPQVGVGRSGRPLLEGPAYPEVKWELRVSCGHLGS